MAVVPFRESPGADGAWPEWGDCICSADGDAACARHWRGRLAQLVEHLVYTENVGGSRPSPPTSPRAAELFFHGLLKRGALALVLALVGLAQIDLARAEPMRFRVARLDSPSCAAKCPDVVVADGVIEPETPGAFLDFARMAALSPGLRGVILINSPGGNVVASMELGESFRRLGMAAIVAGYMSTGGRSGPVAGDCVSACVYALMGATRRVAPPMSHVALHRMSVALSDTSMRGRPGAPARRFADPQLVAALARYAQRMGVNPALVFAAESLAPDHVRILSAGELGRWGMATSQF